MKEKIVFVILCIALISFGWVAAVTYNNIFPKTNDKLVYHQERSMDGLLVYDAEDHSTALENAKSYDKSGDWICVNVNGMEYERAVEVCQHEAAHEIFAEIIEKEPDKINQVMEAIR